MPGTPDAAAAPPASGPAAPSAPARRRELAVAAAAAVGAALLAHGRALSNPFVWDDRHTVIGNAALRSLPALWRSFSLDDWQSYGLRARGLYRPLATLSLFLDHALFGLRPAGWHATSVALHAATALALARLVRAAGVRSSISLLAGLAFAVHPLTAEVADWVSARPDGLAGLLVVCALLAARTGRDMAAGLLAAAACFAKEPGMVAVPAAALVGLSAARRSVAVRGAVLAVAGAAAYLALCCAAQVPANAASARLLDPGAFRHLLGASGDAVAGALSALLWPLPLDAARRLPDLGPMRWAATAGAALGVGWAALASLRRRDGLVAALALVAAAPLLLAAAYGAGLSERYLYLPAAAAVALAALGLERAARAAVPLLRPGLLRVLAGASCLVLIAAAGASASRASTWGDPVALFASATEADPQNAEAWQLLGAELYRRGASREALEAFERAARLGSARAGLFSNLCALRRESGDLTRAQADCDRAVALDPGDPRPRYHRALLWAAAGRRADAAAALEALRRSHPAYRPAREALELLARPAPAP